MQGRTKRVQLFKQLCKYGKSDTAGSMMVRLRQNVPSLAEAALYLELHHLELWPFDQSYRQLINMSLELGDVSFLLDSGGTRRALAVGIMAAARGFCGRQLAKALTAAGISFLLHQADLVPFAPEGVKQVSTSRLNTRTPCADVQPAHTFWDVWAPRWCSRTTGRVQMVACSPPLVQVGPSNEFVDVCDGTLDLALFRHSAYTESSFIAQLDACLRALRQGGTLSFCLHSSQARLVSPGGAC